MAYEGQTFTNARTGQRMTFVELREEMLRIDTVNPVSTAHEPVHVHPEQESGAEVESGVLIFEIAGEQRRIEAGEHVTIPAGTPHRFWNGGDADARAIQSFRPALNIAAFFETYAALAARGKLNDDGLPNMLQLAVMIPAFASEIRVTKPPWSVQRALATVLAPVARARGYQPTLQLT